MTNTNEDPWKKYFSEDESAYWEGLMVFARSDEEVQRISSEYVAEGQRRQAELGR